MTYIENVFICIVAPLLIAMVCMGRSGCISFFFLIVGMSMCLLSAYINTFFARLCGAGISDAAVEITPVIEETMKLLPPLFYLMVFEPTRRETQSAVLLVAVGFATFENICYLIDNGAAQIWLLLMRGFGTGSMHVVCGAIVSYGLLYVWVRPWLKLAGTLGLMSMAITYHAIYNLLLSKGGAAQTVGLLIPILTVLSGIGITKLQRRKMQA